MNDELQNFMEVLKMKKLMMMTTMAVASLWTQTAKADENRLNLWPLLGYEDGELDVIWPLGHFKSSQEWRFFPIIKDRDLFCVFPEFWFANDGFAVLPLVAEYDFGRGTLFPILWWDFEGSDKTHSVFPLYYYHGRDKATTFWAGCGLAGYNRNHNEVSHWLLPLYAKTPRSFTSLPYHRTWNEKGETTSWISPLALSGGTRKDSQWSDRYLLGLAGRNADANKGFHDSWCAPFYYANNQGTLVTPLYGQTADAKWGLPGWYKDEHTFASPLWYHHTGDQGQLDQWMIPALLSGGVYRDGVRKNGFLLNAAGWMSDDRGYAASWCMPLYYWNNQGTFVTPLYGHNRSSQWCFPLWYRDDRSLYSLLWCQEKDSAGNLESWTAPLLLSGGKTKADGSHEADFLFGLGGATWGGKDGRRSSWAFPFYREDSDGNFATLLGGWSKDYSWILPLYYTDKDSFISLPYAHSRNDVAKSDSYVIPPLLSGCTKYDNGRTDLTALLLYGHSRDAKGTTRYDYLLPLYHYNGQSGDFTSVLYGTRSEGSHTNTWWATPLVGTRSGSKTGGWLFPLFNREKDASFDKDLARLDSPTLPDDIAFTDHVHCSTNSEGEVSCWSNRVASINVSSMICGSFLLGSDHDSSVRGRVGHHYGKTKMRGKSKDIYELREESNQGNRIIFNRESSRTVTYDIPTRQKTGDERSSETTVLCGLFHDKRWSDAEKTSYARTRVLWKLWDREEKDGNVTVDAFPGFIYDSKTNGYSKTSLLWRFFRYEKDPKSGTKLDLLFLPIVR